MIGSRIHTEPSNQILRIALLSELVEVFVHDLSQPIEQPSSVQQLGVWLPRLMFLLIVIRFTHSSKKRVYLFGSSRVEY